MSRYIKPRIRLFVEGKTEDNYFKELAKTLNLDFSIETIDMNGGGYSNFLNQIKKKGQLGCTFIFIIIDLDKVCDDKKNFSKLVKYCNEQNKRVDVPYFLIGNYKDFEYFACLHSNEYKEGDTKYFIINKFNYKNIDSFKSNNKIFNFLNSNGRSYENAINKISKKQAYIYNEYKPVNKNGGDIVAKNIKIKINDNLENIKNSNMNDLFNIIGQAIKK